MKIAEVQDRTPELLSRLLEIWEASVRATHLFLSEEEIGSIREYVPQALEGIAHLIAAEEETGCPAAFMGIEDGSLEMLFIAPEERGKGLGKRLIRYGLEHYDVTRLAVNEQNLQARGFYEHMGFRVYKRADSIVAPTRKTDGSGRGFYARPTWPRFKRWLSLIIFFFLCLKFSGAGMTRKNHACPCLELSISRQPPWGWSI